MLVWRYASLIWPLLLLLLLLSMSFFFPFLPGLKSQGFSLFSPASPSRSSNSQSGRLWDCDMCADCDSAHLIQFSWLRAPFCWESARGLLNISQVARTDTIQGQRWAENEDAFLWLNDGVIGQSDFFFWGVLSFFNAKGHLNPSKHEPATHTIC